MILVGISRSWEALEISRSRVTFLTSSRLTFSKKNRQREFSSFTLKMLGCFSKVLIAFTIGSLCSLEISERLMLRPPTIPSNKTERFHQLQFLPKWLYHFQQVLFVSSFSVFSVKLGFTVFQKDLSVIQFTLRLF